MRKAIKISQVEIGYKNVAAPSELLSHKVLLKLQRIRVCWRDINVFHREHPGTLCPVVQWQEYSVAVEAMGDNVIKA